MSQTYYYIPQKKTTTLSTVGGITAADQTTGIKISDVTGITITVPGLICVNWSDPINTDLYEYISYTSIDGTNELQGVVRGAEGSTARTTHSTGVTVAWVYSKSHINNINDVLNGVTEGIKVKTSLQDANGNEAIKIAATASAVNEITVTNGATGSGPIISATGGDDNIGLDIKLKGTSYMRKPTVTGVQVYASDASVDTGDGKAFFRVPAELNGMNLVGVAACVYTAGTTSTTDIQLRNKTDSVDMLSTKITIDSAETDSSTAATAAVINTSYDDVATGDLIAIDIDAASTTKPSGLYVEMRFALPA